MLVEFENIKVFVCEYYNEDPIWAFERSKNRTAGGMNVKQDESWERMNDKTVSMGWLREEYSTVVCWLYVIKTAMNDYVCEEYTIYMYVCIYIYWV